VGKPERRRPLGVPTFRRKFKTKNDLKSPGWRVGSVDWIDMAQDRIGAFIKSGEFLEYLCSNLLLKKTILFLLELKIVVTVAHLLTLQKILVAGSSSNVSGGAWFRYWVRHRFLLLAIFVNSLNLCGQMLG
jgi:hypothetical protein